MSEPAYTPSRRRPVREFFVHLVEMPRWHKVVLALAAVLVVYGLSGMATRRIAGNEPAATSSEAAPPAGSARAFGSADAPPSAPPAAAAPTLTERFSPAATRVGLGFIGGFVIGWAFRAFLKIMATVTFLIAAVFAGLSYFNILNIDFSAAETKVKTSTEWVSDQAGRAKDAAMSHVPGSLSSFLGMFVGFRRK